MKAKGDKNFPWTGVFARVGKKAELVTKILEYCEGRDGYNDIVGICKPISLLNSPAPISLVEPESYGYVYLMKSGNYYKIGKSISPGRREYELAIQLPERIAKIHEIKTDDPTGIEAYWHKRFKDKRKNGEWFDLTAEDIKAFKRRKFM